MTDPIDMQFGIKSSVGPRNHVLGGGLDLSMGRGNFVFFIFKFIIRLVTFAMAFPCESSNLAVYVTALMCRPLHITLHHLPWGDNCGSVIGVFRICLLEKAELPIMP